MSRASASRAAAFTKPRKCPSIHSRVKSFGTTSEKVSSVELARGRVAEPGRVRGLVECLTEPAGDVVPQAFGGRLGGRAPPFGGSSQQVAGRASIAASSRRLNPPERDSRLRQKYAYLQEFPPSTRVSTPVDSPGAASLGWQRRPGPRAALSSSRHRARRLWISRRPKTSSILTPRVRTLRPTHPPTERAHL